MQYEYRVLRGRITEKYGTIKHFAEACGLSEVAVSKKLNNRTGLSQKDVENWSKLLDVQRRDIGDIFFT